MTEEQKKAIDACKDQAAKEWAKKVDFKMHGRPVEGTWTHIRLYIHESIREELSDRAMQLYGEQCRKEGIKEGCKDTAEIIKPVNPESTYLLAPQHDFHPDDVN